MISKIKIILILILLVGCNYKPALLDDKNDFHFAEVRTEGDLKINKIIKEKLSEKTTSKSDKKYKIYFFTKKNKEIIASNRKGDPTIYKINISLNYEISDDYNIIIKNQLSKQVTYNNINDKFELQKYEDNILKNLSTKLSDDIIMSLKTF